MNRISIDFLANKAEFQSKTKKEKSKVFFKLIILKRYKEMLQEEKKESQVPPKEKEKSNLRVSMSPKQREFQLKPHLQMKNDEKLNIRSNSTMIGD